MEADNPIEVRITNPSVADSAIAAIVAGQRPGGGGDVSISITRGGVFVAQVSLALSDHGEIVLAVVARGIGKSVHGLTVAPERPLSQWVTMIPQPENDASTKREDPGF